MVHFPAIIEDTNCDPTAGKKQIGLLSGEVAVIVEKLSVQNYDGIR